MITPIRKPADRDLLDWEMEFNTQVNKIRYVIEQVIANFKTWRIMHTESTVSALVDFILDNSGSAPGRTVLAGIIGRMVTFG
ncbi:MAG: hypothetical protein ACRDSP_01200 [Pseudonocardiaceae bacterium]